MARMPLSSARRRAQGLLSLTSLVLAVAAFDASVASAGNYTVHSCRTPIDTPAPMGQWELKVYDPTIDRHLDTCPRGGLMLQMDGRKVHSTHDSISVQWNAPADTQIASYTLWRSVKVASSTMYYYAIHEWYGSSYRTVESCLGRSCTGRGDMAQPLAARNRFARPPLPPITGVQFYLSCAYTDGKTPCEATSGPISAQAMLHRADIVVADDRAPTFVVPPRGGLLESTGPVAGLQSVSVLAQDRGGGLASADVELDGAVVTQQPFEAQRTSCREPYVDAVPCPLEGSTTVSLDTARYANGPHRVRVLARDAAGNVTASDPVTLTFANRSTECAPSPIDAAAGRASARLTPRARKRQGRHVRHAPGRGTITVPYGRGATLVATLRGPDRQPLAGVPVCVGTRAPRSGELPAPLRLVTTDARGRISVDVPPGPSREVWIVHRTASGAIASRANLRVRPKVTARPSRRSFRTGQTLVVRGRVHGTPIPARGLLLELQARRGRKWQTFKTGHASASGRYRIRYTFTRTGGVQRYLLRVRVPQQAAYPFAPGGSRSMALRVTG